MTGRSSVPVAPAEMERSVRTVRFVAGVRSLVGVRRARTVRSVVGVWAVVGVRTVRSVAPTRRRTAGSLPCVGSVMLAGS